MKIPGYLSACALLVLACGSSKPEGTAGGAGPIGAGGGPGSSQDSGAPGAGGAGGATGGCTGQALPSLDDYGAPGPFATTVVNNTGPDGNYTMYRPTTLGENGFKHPPATWGNGIGTTPVNYIGLLSTVASNGVVVIASNSTGVNAQLMTAGLDWLLAQNDAPGDFKGQLATSCAVSIGYSLGGKGAVDTGKHPKVVTTVSFHGLTGDSASLHGPLLLYTGTEDTFVSAAQFVDPTFKASTVQTFYATLTAATHLRPLNDAGEERGPTMAWLRLWLYGDQAARPYFDGADCTLCKDPWTNPQRKRWP
jgi:hypothetical protein